MLLAIDCGNTNTVFSVWDGERFLGTWRTSTEWQRTADQYYVWLSTLMRFQKVEADITDVIISSTVPRVVFNLRVLADRYFNTRPIVVGKPECLLPVDVRVDAGTAVGPDRLVNTVAGHDLYGGDLIIVAERDREMRVIATGGLAPLFQQTVDLFDAYQDDLTMHGLTVIYTYNKDTA